MFGDKFGHFLDRPLENVAKKISFHPNTLTVIGFLITVIASLVLLRSLALGGILVIAGALFDVLDGVVARTNGKKTKFGAFLDSVLDRFSDALILLAIGWNLNDHGNFSGLILAVLTLVGSFMISYVRARAEGLGEKCTKGILERPERIVLLSIGAVSGYMVPVLWIMFVLTQLTVLQRIYHTWKMMSHG
ncbi:MAG TPA: CDP-alcohol phosphatidyltransferase family protein [Candidatus Sulfobium mesophilum]|nr:CDP-alcohol phosphatidyltransferase family protein [Candidatus Sulfobium mesophilum]